MGFQIQFELAVAALSIGHQLGVLRRDDLKFIQLRIETVVLPFDQFADAFSLDDVVIVTVVPDFVDQKIFAAHGDAGTGGWGLGGDGHGFV